MNNKAMLKALGLVFFVLALNGCATPVRDSSAYTSTDAETAARETENFIIPAYVRNLPKSKTGNMDEYTVFGKKYRVMDSAANFVETGEASWYGTKFHGRKTSSGEIYDMHAMTAAHKYLPIPTYALVTHLESNKSIVVLINDRGPFVGERIIDLSYAAAQELGMAEQGVAPVKVVALSTHYVDEENVGEENSLMDDGFVELTPTSDENAVDINYFIQLGAFSSAPNAKSLANEVAELAGLSTYIEQNSTSTLFRVKLGPIVGDAQLNNMISELESAGIEKYTLLAARTNIQ